MQYYTFVGDPTTILEKYPERSKHLEKHIESRENVKELNPRFIKDEFMYLLRGAKNGQETGFYSQEYAKGNTIENLSLDPNFVALAQSLNGNTPFISATTNLYVAASFANDERIYILKIPVEDVYNFSGSNIISDSLEEYMILDYVKKEEIVRSFRHDKFRGIYNFLINEIGLDIIPEDLGEMDDINCPNME